VDQTFQLFSECLLCRRLERRKKEAFYTRVRIRDFAAGETIFVTGSPADSVMIVLRGTVQARATSPKSCYPAMPCGLAGPGGPIAGCPCWDPVRYSERTPC
jgi:hypothetical protein